MDDDTKIILEEINDKVGAIKGWITFLGILVVIGLIFNSCSSILGI